MHRVTGAATALAKEASIAADVIRCRCGDPGSHTPQPCPAGLEEARGIISYSNCNPLKQWWWDIKQAWKEGRQR